LTIESLQMQLPVLTLGGAGVPDFAAVEPPLREPSDTTWAVTHDVLNRVTKVITGYGSTFATRHGGRMTDRYDGHATMPIDDQAQASAGGVVRFEIDWPEASVAVESRLQVRSDGADFAVEIELHAFESGVVVAERRWSHRFPRQLA
jgi:hypothetical protein